MLLRTFAFGASIGAVLASCAQNSPSSDWIDVVIDPSVSERAEAAIDTSAFDIGGGRMPKGFVYDNLVVAEIYKNDTLDHAYKESDDRKTVFKSFYGWRNDTIFIDGAFGLFGGTGFSVRLSEGKAEVRHLLAADEEPEFAYSDTDTLQYRLDVPCKETQLVLSEYPDSLHKKPIHGYVSFKSSTFCCTRGERDGHEILPRNHMQENMRIYFRSVWLDRK